jgi:hypothetical protein
VVGFKIQNRKRELPTSSSGEAICRDGRIFEAGQMRTPKQPVCNENADTGQSDRGDPAR